MSRIPLILGASSVVLLGAFFSVKRASDTSYLRPGDGTPSSKAVVAPAADQRPIASLAGGTVEPTIVGSSTHDKDRRSILAGKIMDALLERSLNTRTRKFLEILEKMDPADAPEMLDLLRRMEKNGQGGKSERTALWRRWGELDPGAALKFLGEQPQKSQSTKDGYMDMFEGWADRDSSAALKWLSEQTTHANFEQAFSGFINAYARIDATEATRLALSSLPADDKLLGTAMMSIASQVQARGSASGLQRWFDQLPKNPVGDSARKAVADAVGDALLNYDLSSAISWIEQQASTEWRSNNSIHKAAREYAAKDPAAAMDWISKLPPNKDGYFNGPKEVVLEWVKKDPGGLETWLNRNPGTVLFAQTAGYYAMQVGAKDLQRSTYWLNQIDPVQTPVLANYFRNEFAKKFENQKAN